MHIAWHFVQFARKEIQSEEKSLHVMKAIGLKKFFQLTKHIFMSKTAMRNHFQSCQSYKHFSTT